MSKQAMEMALEALEELCEHETLGQHYSNKCCCQAIAALKEAIKNQGEPVVSNEDERLAVLDRIVNEDFRASKRNTSAPTIPADVAKDAARYRWLRDHCTDMENPSDTWIVEAPGDLWDDAIDTAMLSAAPKGEQP